MAKANLSAERLREVIHYNPETGVFTRTVASQGPKHLVGKVAGNPHAKGYWEMRIDGYALLAHRAAWMYMTGKMPDGEVDHINGNRQDNRWHNLRVVSKSINMQNRHGPDRDNLTGFLGVTKHGSGFRAIISVNHKRHNLGTYRTAEEAHSAYLAAKRRLHEGCTI